MLPHYETIRSRSITSSLAPTRFRFGIRGLVVFPDLWDTSDMAIVFNSAGDDASGSNSPRDLDASRADAEAAELLLKLNAWTLTHFKSADFPKCPVCQATKWTWHVQVHTTDTGRRYVLRVCDACSYAMRFDADTIGI